MRAASLVLALVFFAGCLEAIVDDGDSPDCPRHDPSAPEALLSLPTSPSLPTDPEQELDLLYFVRNASQPLATQLQVPNDWTSSWTTHGGANDSNLWSLRLNPGTRNPEAGFVTLDWHVAVNPGCGYTSKREQTELQWPAVGDRVQVGHGALVMTAGFLPNGTLFYTNMESVNDLSDWPATSGYAWEGGDPLPVYVYDRDRNERPPEWNATVAGPQGEESLWSYFTTIKGFNEALKGLSVNTARVVYINATDAYTQPGREEHPLFGHDLVFYIRVLEAVEEPWCPGLPQLVPCAARP